MENKETSQTITLVDKKSLTVSGTNKVISLKPDLIQLDTILGGVIISGQGLELLKLDNISTRAEIKGDINSIKFAEAKNKQPFFRKIFK